jgi:tetratricopeptide (TPR) repeat protein
VQVLGKAYQFVLILAPHRTWRARFAWGYAFIQHMLTTVEQTVQRREAELKAELERQASAVTEAEAKRKSEEAEQQRVAAVKAEQDRQAKAAAEAEAKRKGDEAERQRLAAVKAEQERQARAAAELEAKRKATEAEQRQPAVVNPEEARRGAWLGVKIQQVTDEIAKSLNITPARGALVAGVDEEGPAKAGGIYVGDVIVKFDGKDIKEMRDLPHIVADTPVGKEVQVTIIRNGAEYTRTVKIGVLTAEVEEKRKADEEARARYSALVSQGNTDANAGDHDRAIADFNEAIRLDPKSAYSFYSRGLAYGRKGDFDRAIADYNEAIRIDPRNASAFGERSLAFNNRGNAYRAKGDNDRAIADYNEAIRLNPQYALAFCNRGRTKLRIPDSGGNEDIAKAKLGS